MGFSLDSLPGKHAYIVLSKTVVLPAGLPRVKVRISFFPEGVLYDKVKPAPLSVWEPEAVRLLDGTIEIGQRVVGFQRYGANGDLVVATVVDGKQVFFDKAKRDRAYDIELEQHTIPYTAKKRWVE